MRVAESSQKALSTQSRCSTSRRRTRWLLTRELRLDCKAKQSKAKQIAPHAHVLSPWVYVSIGITSKNRVLAVVGSSANYCNGEQETACRVNHRCARLDLSEPIGCSFGAEN